MGCRLWGRTESDTTDVTWQQSGPKAQSIPGRMPRKEELEINLENFFFLPHPGFLGETRNLSNEI